MISIGYGLGHLIQSKLDGNIKRLGNVVAYDRSTGVSGTLNFLVVGSDSRAARPGEESLGERSDTIMLMHLPQDRKSAWFVSIPRDSWVQIPGHGKDKINAAFALGGARLLRQTVEGMTGIPIDHYLQIDFTGFSQLADAVGGVDVTLPADSYDPETRARFKAGINHLDGKQALSFVRQRHGLPDGDFGRINRQHEFVTALMDKATSAGMLTNPVALGRLVDAGTKAISVDSALSGGDLRTLVWSLRRLHSRNLNFFTLPVARVGKTNNHSVVFLDWSTGRRLYEAIRREQIAGWARSAGHGPATSAGSNPSR